VASLAENVLNAVESVVKDDNNWVDAVTAHHTDFCGSQLMGTVASNEDRPALGFGEGYASRGRSSRGSGDATADPCQPVLQLTALFHKVEASSLP
jgi:hypothetical protein